jgi:formate hydrogenlyase transcriptional activator
MKDKSVILVVDDQPQNTELLEAHLVPQGYEIVKAASGEEALKILSGNQIDLVLLDVMMPGMSGFEVLEKIRADKKTRLIPVVMVTVLKETEDRVKALEAGCDDFISKPLDRHVLLARVKSLLRIKSLHDEVEEAREFVESIINTVREPLIVLDENLKVVTVSRSFYDFFKVKPEETLGQLIYDLGNKQWNIPRLRDLLEETLPENTVYKDFEVEHDFETIGPKIMHLNARRICQESSLAPLILLAIEDVTEREYYKRNLEKIVETRTAELVLAKQEAEKGKQAAETSLSEIKILKEQLEQERAYLKEEIKLEHNHENIIGKSDALKHVLYKVEQIAQSDTTVLVLGETGTGKELVARAVQGFSKRKNRALVKVNCAALPSNLIESELFGHEKGAFTGSSSKRLGRFEVADGATLFLDEIGELPLELQSKLLRVIQEGEFERLGSSHTIKVDVRIIVATNRNLEEEVRQGRFRDDLWYRLNVFPITMPPLRERTDDIPPLVEFYINKISKRMGKDTGIIPKSVMNTLQNYHWPGNVRELENVLERAVINSSGPKLHLVDDLNKPYAYLSKSQKTLEIVERDYIVRMLEQTHWKVSGKDSAAQILGLNRSTLRARMRKLDIRKP